MVCLGVKYINEQDLLLEKRQPNDVRASACICIEIIMDNMDTSQQLRASVGTYNQVIFPHPEDGTMMLALERRATVLKDGSVSIRSQPFGGGVRILNPRSLQAIIGKIQFDSERSKQEQDFRILIPPSKWELIKEYSLHHLEFEEEEDSEIESGPDRELTEEFLETINVKLNPRQYTVQPLGFVVENKPVRSKNDYALGQLTVHLYRVFKVQIIDSILCKVIWSVSQLYSDQDLGERALQNLEYGGKGRANTILTLPLHQVRDSYLALSPDMRYQKIVIDKHELDESVLAILEDIEVPQYQRL